eukprot:m.954945 g.954945  ORF g.954945 m.954945 type:complete len:760 (-) comp23871_c1_seq65:70-2349(-)
MPQRPAKTDNSSYGSDRILLGLQAAIETERSYREQAKNLERSQSQAHVQPDSGSALVPRKPLLTFKGIAANRPRGSSEPVSSAEILVLNTGMAVPIVATKNSREIESTRDLSTSYQQQPPSASTKSAGRAPTSHGNASAASDPRPTHHGHRTNASLAAPTTTYSGPPAFSLPDDFPHDRISVTMSPLLRGVPVVERSTDERTANPERLNLDNLGFTVCPLLENESNLRLVNFQHNRIQRIENLSNLRHLIFLDLYDNQIADMTGLESVPSLRVLMLGCNKIADISSALRHVPMLDVLDLHKNEIADIGPHLRFLTNLRVLNLSYNRLETVDGIATLTLLNELNLRGNRIASVRESFEPLRYLQSVNLSDNALQSLAHASAVLASPALAELHVSGNDMCSEHFFKERLIDGLRMLRLLDGKRVNEDERRVAGINLRKQNDKRRAAERAHMLRAQRTAAISALRTAWEQRTPPQEHIKGHYDIENDHIHIYGEGFGVFDKQWPATVTTMTFQYVNFDAVAAQLNRSRNRCQTITRVVVRDTGMSSFRDANALAVFRRLQDLEIHDGEPFLRNVTLWRKYLLFRLGHLPSLKTINGSAISADDIAAAREAFSAISDLFASDSTSSSTVTATAARIGSTGDDAGVGMALRRPTTTSTASRRAPSDAGVGRMTSASKMTSTPAGVSTSSASSVDDYYHHHPQRGGAIANPKVAAQSFVNAVTTYAVNRSDLRHEFESVLEEALAKYISETLCGAQSGARTAEDK